MPPHYLVGSSKRDPEPKDRLNLRTRAILNRLRLGGEGANIRQARRDVRLLATARTRGEPPPEPRARPTLCGKCPAGVPETLEHILFECTLHIKERVQWNLAMHKFVAKVLEAANTPPFLMRSRAVMVLHETVTTPREAFWHLVLASPFVCDSTVLSSHELATVLKTGSQILHEIKSVRPM
jgi:hypothetical protein